jgi:hypothetical protein
MQLILRAAWVLPVGGLLPALEDVAQPQPLDLRYSRYLIDRRLLLEPTYRLHVQQAADDYRETWSDPLPQYRTSDPDLGGFISHTVGVQATFLDQPWFGARGDWDISAYASTRSNGLDAFWFIIGHRMEF